MESLLHDVKQGLRILWRSPGFTIAAVTTLALGIGANTAVFSVVSAVLLKPARFADPDRTVWLSTTMPTGPDYGSSDPKFNMWRQQTNVLEDVTGQAYAKLNLTGVDSPEQVQAARVTSAYFRLVGLRLAKGHGFIAEEDGPAGRRVVVLSDGFWNRHFGGDPGIIGGNITLDGAPYEVVGITVPGAQTEAQAPPDLWIPLQIDPNSNSQVEYFLALARLKPGVTLSMARAQLQISAEEYRRKFPNTVTMQAGYSFGADPVEDAMVRNIRPSLLILLGAVASVLLIACANIANLLLFRGVGRRREIAIRLALGAARTRIVRQLLTESVMLALAGGAVGLLVGSAAIRGLLNLNPAIPRIGVYGYHVAVDWRVLTFTALISLLTGFVFGLMPAFESSRGDVNTSLKAGHSGAGNQRNAARSVLVISEMSLALVLLIGAGLLIRSFIDLQAVKPGFDVRSVLTLRMSLTSSRFETTYQVSEFVRDAVQRLGSLPEIVSASAASWLPFETGATLPFVVVGRPLNGPSHGFGHWRNISPAYFLALKIPLLRGRFFTDRDDGKTAKVVIINEAMARQYWLGKDPLNEQIDIAPNVGPEFDEPPRQIVGIVGNILEDSLDQRPLPTMYVPIAQVADARMPRIRQSIVWIVRTRAEPHSVIPAVSHELREASGGLPAGGFRSMSEIVEQSTARQHFNMELLSVFGGVALSLAAIGVYGLISFSVQQRTQEIGIRLALGAGSSDVLRMVVVQGMRLALIGVAIGLCAALGLTRFLVGFLFGVHALDPAVFIISPIALAVVAFLAVWLPARRASRLNPIEALRHE
ncbi:MAG TPA: ABC transporter permease [Terriglobales bacterium]